MGKEKKDIRIVFSIFAVISCLIGWSSFPSTWSFLFSGGALLLMVLLTVAPLRLLSLYRMWLKIARFIGGINTYLLLAMVFYLLLTPMGLIMRVLGKNLLKRDLDKKSSYWESYEISGLLHRNQYEKQF